MIGKAARALTLIAVYALATTVGPTSDTSINDLYVYSVYHDLLQQGLAPYSGFGFEYPPLALYPIALAGGSAWKLGIAMLACLLVTQWCCERLAGPTAGWLMAAAPLLLGAMVRTHLDALPAALAMGALVAFAAQRPRLAFALLGLGTMVKLWPVVLVPVAVVWLVARGQRALALQGAAIVAAICVAVLAPFPWHGLRDAVRYHQDRPVQIESSPASVLWLAGDSYVTGDPVRPDRFKSNGLDGGPAAAVSLLFTILEVVGDPRRGGAGRARPRHPPPGAVRLPGRDRLRRAGQGPVAAVPRLAGTVRRGRVGLARARARGADRRRVRLHAA